VTDFVISLLWVVSGAYLLHSLHKWWDQENHEEHQPQMPTATVSLEAIPPGTPDFPCAEGECWSTAVRQLSFTLPNRDVYRVGVCSTHEARVRGSDQH